MSYNISEIKNDIVNMHKEDFYIKYLIRSNNWYFENILSKKDSEIMSITDEFKFIVSKSFGVSFNNVLMVGSGKTGYSFSPSKKAFKKFNSQSDIDIAIISNNLFLDYWTLFRKNYSLSNKYLYGFISRGIYRGYISERNINNIDECKVIWTRKSNISNKKLKEDLYFQNKISYRIYRQWEDFEEYTLQSIELLAKKLKGDINNEI